MRRFAERTEFGLGRISKPRGETMIFYLASALIIGIALYAAFDRIGLIARLDEERTAKTILWTAILLYIIVFSVLSVLKHRAYGSSVFDMGLHDQVLWNTSHGRLFETSLHLRPNNLSDHVDLVFLFLAPLYRVFPSINFLLVLQTIFIGIVARPIFSIIARMGGRPLSGLAAGVAYLLCPIIQHVNLFDFHLRPFMLFFICVALLALIDDRPRLYWLMILSVLILKETTALTVIGLGAFVLLATKKRLQGALTICIGSAWLLIAIHLVIPHFLGGPYIYTRQFGNAGFLTLAKNIATEPGVFLETIFADNAVSYLKNLFGPAGFLPLFNPVLLIPAIPVLAQNLLSRIPDHSVFSQHNIGLVPFLFLAAGTATRRIGSWFGKARKRKIEGVLALYLATIGFMGTYYLGASPLARGFDASKYEYTQKHRELDRIVASIPKDASVMAQSKITPHLSQRRNIYFFPLVEAADYIILDVGSEIIPLRRMEDYRINLALLLANPDYGLTYYYDGILLFRRNIPASEKALREIKTTDWFRELPDVALFLQDAKETADLGLTYTWDEKTPLLKWTSAPNVSEYRVQNLICGSFCFYISALTEDAYFPVNPFLWERAPSGLHRFRVCPVKNGETGPFSPWLFIEKKQ